MQFSEPLRDHGRAWHVGFLTLLKERAQSRRQSVAEALGLKGANVGSVEAGERLGG